MATSRVAVQCGVLSVLLSCAELYEAVLVVRVLSNE
jgi:hypothetical protein